MDPVDKTYVVRPGTIDVGREYEYNMTALLSLRCIAQNVEDVWIASNIDDVGDFDDIIIRGRLSGGENVTIMIQLKHQEKAENITEEDFLGKKHGKKGFSLLKYKNDIDKLKQKIALQQNGIVEDLGAFDEIYFILFTNKGVDACTFLEKEEPLMSSLISTNNADAYKFDFSKLSSNNNDFNNAHNNFRKFFLFPSQMNAKQVAEEVVVEIKNMFGSLGLTQINAKSLAKDFINYITNWARGNFDGHYYLTKQEVLCKLSELYLRPLKLSLIYQPFSFYDCPKKLIWNDIVQDNDLIVIKSDDRSLQFLFEYLGSEIRKYCKGPLENWTDDISECDKNYVFQQLLNDKYKRQLSKVIGNDGVISPLDIYKSMCMIKQMPLLLNVNKMQDFQNILGILKFSNNCFKIIVIHEPNENLHRPCTGEPFCVLQDLSKELKIKILDCSVKLQGRKSVVLKTLVDDEICKLITSRDVVDILSNNFYVGNEIKALPEYFIERDISKVLVQAEVLLTSSDDIFLVEHNVRNQIYIKNKTIFKYQGIDFQNSKGAFIVTGLKNATWKQKQSLMVPGNKNIHYLSAVNTKHLEWKWSTGLSMDNLLPFCVMEQHFENTVNIISAPPGMGKTYFMDLITHRAPKNKWVLRINLNKSNYIEHYRNDFSIQSIAHLRFFNNQQLNENKCCTKLAQMVFEKLLSERNVIVILDGFDEVSFSFKDQVTAIAKSFSRDGYQIWVTTRPHMAPHLEKEFNVCSRTLKPFDIDAQGCFLTKYFGYLNPGWNFSPELLQQFVNKLLQAAKNNLNDGDAEFTGIPLQSRLLAEVFNDDCKEYVGNNGDSTFNE